MGFNKLKMDKLDREALDPKWFNEYYPNFDTRLMTNKELVKARIKELNEKDRNHRDKKT